MRINNIFKYKVPKNRRLKASDLHIVMGNGYDTTTDDLIQYTVGTKQRVFSEQSKSAMTHGIMTENLAKQWFMHTHCKDLKDAYYAYCEWNPRFIGAADGILNDDEILEIKCPRQMYTDIQRLGCKAVKPMYYDQIQGELMLYNAQRCHFVVYATSSPCTDVYHEIIERDTDYIENHIKPKITEYFEMLDQAHGDAVETNTS